MTADAEDLRIAVEALEAIVVKHYGAIIARRALDRIKGGAK
jgi:hypothetical protein